MPAQEMELVFPLKGINETWAFGRQPGGTCPDAQNVIAFDPLNSRARGGQRWGLSKVFAAQHNSTNAIQRMTTVAFAVVNNSRSVLTETFTQANGQLDDTNWYVCSVIGSYFEIDATHPTIASNKVVVNNTTHPSNVGDIAAVFKTELNLFDDYELSADVTLAAEGNPGVAWVHLFPNLPSPSFPNYDPWIASESSDARGYAGIELEESGGNYTFQFYAGSDDSGVLAATPASNDYLDPTWWASTRTLKVTQVGSTVTLYADDVQIFQSTDAYNQIQGFVGFRLRRDGTDDVITLDNFTLTVTAPESVRMQKLIAVSGGDVFHGRLSKDSLVAALDGTNAVATSGRIDMQAAFDKVYFADGAPANYKYFDNGDNTVYAWTASTAGDLPMASNQVTATLTAATPATPSFTIAEDWSGRAAGDWLRVAGSTANDGYYTIASTSGSGPTVITVNETVADNTVDGTIQYQDQACQIIKSYRGRVIMAGLVTDPQNWFMSAVDDPLDWDYGATVSATMAVAGNQTDAGKCPDIITCLAPYSDDLMFIGGDHTLWRMTGDPADRGRIDNVSYQTGISGPDAYAFDPNGTFYFFGSGAVWRLAGEGAPEPISRNRLDQIFKAINLTTHTVHLAWDNIGYGLLISVVPSSQTATTHYYWDERTDSFWKFVFPATQGPSTVLTFDGDDPDDTTVLLGGWDGYIRKIDSSVTDDDGTAITSYVLYPPIVNGPVRNTRVNSLTAVLDTDSDNVVLTAFAEETAQKVIESATSSDAAVSITAVSTSNGTFSVAEDWSARLAGDRLLVAGSTGNDGSYTLASISGSGPTVLTVAGTVANATIDGTIQYKDRAKFIRTLSSAVAGRTKVIHRIAGNAILLKLSNSVDETTWAIESLTANVEVVGHTRKNQL